MQPVIKSPIYTYVDYPKWLYHATQNPVLVNDAAAHGELGPGWQDSPVATQVTTSQAIATIASTAEITIDDAKAQSEAAELYAAPISTITAMLATVKRATLDRVREFELKNPRPEGPRKRVIESIDKRLAQLAEGA